MVYLTLAILIGGGLILFGVGTGVGGGGLLNAFNGGGGNAQSAVSQAEKKAEKKANADPTNAAAWAALVQAAWSSAGQGSNFDSATGTFTTAGKKELAHAAAAWEKYQALTKGKDPNDIAVLAGRAYASLGNYGGEANAWEVEANVTPNTAKPYACLALSAYAAKQNRKGDLAMAKALSLTPKAQQAKLKSEILAAKTQPSLATQC